MPNPFPEDVGWADVTRVEPEKQPAASRKSTAQTKPKIEIRRSFPFSFNKFLPSWLDTLRPISFGMMLGQLAKVTLLLGLCVVGCPVTALQCLLTMGKLCLRRVVKENKEGLNLKEVVGQCIFGCSTTSNDELVKPRAFSCA